MLNVETCSKMIEEKELVQGVKDLLTPLCLTSPTLRHILLGVKHVGGPRRAGTAKKNE